MERPKKSSIAELSLQSLIDIVPDLLWVKDAEGRVIICNAATANAHKRSRDQLLGLTDFDFFSHEMATRYRQVELEIMETGKARVDFEQRLRGSDGREFWLASTKVPLFASDGSISGIVGAERDITERKLAEASRDAQSHILELVATGASLKSTLSSLGQLAVEQTGSQAEVGIFIGESSGQGYELYVSEAAEDPDTSHLVELFEGIRDGGGIRHPVALDTLDTSAVSLRKYGYQSSWLLPISSNTFGDLGFFLLASKSLGVAELEDSQLFTILTRLACVAIERKRTEDQIRHVATHDTLTGLPNRYLLMDRLNHAIGSAERKRLGVGIVFIDLDNFKTINDTFGHDVGDEVLKVAAKRIEGCLRKVDSVIRLGGDEFLAVIVDQDRECPDVSGLADRIIQSITRPTLVKNNILNIRCSIGVSRYPADGTTGQALIANADAAMYIAKEEGRNRSRLYGEDVNDKFRLRSKLRADLANAVARSQLFLVYQPQMSLKTGQIVCAEALMRWRHPELGIIFPDRFIYLAEESDLINDMGRWAIEEACRQNKLWQAEGLRPIKVSVNVSARQLNDADLAETVRNILDNTGLDPRYLELEVTESSIIRNMDQALKTLTALKDFGVSTAIDDFGTGYSSLSALKVLPVQKLKIDKSLLSNVTNTDGDDALMAAVISLGRKLGMIVIAEGVETQEQLDFLRANDCDEIQGYFFSRPIPAKELRSLLANTGKQGSRAKLSVVRG